MFCRATEAAVRAFQSGRGLRVDGRCDEQTWTALVEASWKLGDRLLFLTLAQPARRRRGRAAVAGSARLGFDAGRVDGILGPRDGTSAGGLPAQLRDDAPMACAAPTRFGP